MNREIPPGGGALPVGELPVVDEVLAAALGAQGEDGVRALGLLRDAHRILSGADGLERPGEIVEACVRSAVDALLKLPGAPKDPVGLKSAAKDLLAAVDGFGPPPAGRTGPPGHQAPAGSRAWEPVAQAAEVLRGEIQKPGGQRRRQARGIAERLTGLRLGAAQDEALAPWGDVYSKASATLHGSGTEQSRPAHLYIELLHLTRELLVPLPGRAARVLELAALTDPGPHDAAELARWTDPRAEAFFFRSDPSPAWLGVLDEHAGHLLLADEENGVWSAAPFLEHLAHTAPETAGEWLAGHAAGLAAAGPLVLGALLRLADAGVLPPGGVRKLLRHVLVPARPGDEHADVPRRLVASWAAHLPQRARDGHWVPVIETLLKDTIDLGHAGYQAYRSERSRARAERRPLPELTGVLAREWAARLPEHDATGLLRELVVSLHPADGTAFRWARPVRHALAGLLRHDIEASDRQPWSAYTDLETVRVVDAAFFVGPVLETGPLLARAVLDLAAADAAAGVPLAERLRAWPKIAEADAALHDRVLAAHLVAHPPGPAEGAGTGAVEEWWDLAAETVVRLLANPPTPEGARLAALVLDTCPPSRTASLTHRARAALGPPPPPAALDQMLPLTPDPPFLGSAQTGPVGPSAADQDGLAHLGEGAMEPLVSWWRVWAWSPVLPVPVLDRFTPLLDALRRLYPDGPADPRTAARPRSRHYTTVALDDLLGLAAENGPLTAAAALATAPDAGASGYAMTLHRLVGVDPGAWTADVPAVLGALALPELGAYYLAAAAHHPDAFPNGLAEPLHAALILTGALPPPADPHVPDAAEYAGRAWSGLLDHVWRTGDDLDGALPVILDRLHTLAAPLTRPPTPPPGTATPITTVGRADGGEEELPASLTDTHPTARALSCILGHAAARATKDATVPGDALKLVADVLAARGGEATVAAALGAHLPLLHHHAPAFAAAHPDLYAIVPGTPSPAAAWLADGPGLDPLLLAALDRGRLLAVLRAQPCGGAAFRVGHALLSGHDDLLGDPVNAWRELAAGPGGTEAASDFLGFLALFTRTGPPDRVSPNTEQVWWTAALDADLPPGALAGAGGFATALTDEVWLPLARRSAAHTPAQEDAGQIAERATAHPKNLDALRLAAHLLTGPAPRGGQDPDVRRHARALLQAAQALPAPEHPEAIEQLRRALVEAGEVDLARTTSMTS
ncbi:hypothetical protein [Streptomyces anulatus]|uniref:hypothetical protein n=1 Tax=Streptomyces anulatus TaxID=1892 RepID=UPI00386AF216|nr:hypothetical protein OG238_00055 [Streptomyces anulatus]WST90444.1 hypothetical protein OG238_41475 [Streptomyces anulatus]